MAYIPIVPAVIPRDKKEVIEMTRTLSFSNEFHLDVVDGKFVAATSWPINPHGTPNEVKAFTDAFTLEVDLMMHNPIPAAREWIEAGADMLVFHIETIDLPSLVDFILYAPRSVSIGVSLHGDTPIESLLPFAVHADYIQLMGIHTIGAQGQPFDTSIFEKIQRVKREFPAMPIHVDGSVNRDTITTLVKAGVNRFVVGSAIVKQSDPEAAYQELCQIVHEG